MKLFSKPNMLGSLFGLSVFAVAFLVVSCGEETEKVTFSAVESVFNSNCKSCHENGDNYAPIFMGYAAVKDKAMNAGLLDRIQADTNPMPPTGKMAAEDIQVFIDWVDGGYLE